MRGIDFRTVAAKVREAEVVGEDDDDVGTLRSRRCMANEDGAGNAEDFFQGHWLS